jgi:hypothetical protein
VPSATGLGADEHTSEPRSLIGPLVQVMGHETRGSDWFAINQQNKALWRSRWRLDGDTDAATASCVCSSVCHPDTTTRAKANRQQSRLGQAFPLS